MARSPAASFITRPSPRTGKDDAAKPRSVAILQGRIPAPEVSSTRDSDSEEAPEDLAARLNWEEQRKYVKEKKIGEGTYANVYKGHLRKDPTVAVAIKKLKVQTEFKDGIAPDAIRECKFLSELSHPHIIHLMGVFSSKDQNVNLVLEYLPMGDLEAIIRNKGEVRYGPPDIKAWMGMLNQAVWWCHENFVLHRDIKPNNIFIAADGSIKLADFGLARSFAEPTHNMTCTVITNWYRPPELFYEARHYTGKVDVWSVACVHAELLMGVPLIQGLKDIECIRAIQEFFGTPSEKTWPGVSKLKGWQLLASSSDSTSFGPLRSKQSCMQTWRTADADEGDLIYQMFQLDPRKRFNARQVLEHPYWKASPRPTRTENLPRRGGGQGKLGEDLKRKAGEVPADGGRADKVARKLDFGTG